MKIEELIKNNERRRIIIDLLKTGKNDFPIELIKTIILSPENERAR
ncbi:MAG: hypothetical protein IIA49_15615 [Bacteroidetes bacterium]|nr:hypothetical protein [Bacteroidota bacterium]